MSEVKLELGAGPFKIQKLVLPGEEKPPPEEDVDKIPEPLPRPYTSDAFRLIMVGSSGSGKSNIFVNLLIKAYPKIFENVYIFCPTFYEDRTLRGLVNEDKKTGESFLDKEDVFTFTEQEEIAQTVQKLTADADKAIAKTTEMNKKRGGTPHPAPKTLMVFDDLTNEIAQATFMKNLFTKGRKHEVSVIIMTNKYKVYNPQIRTNATHYIFFRPGTDQEADDIAEDIRGNYTVENMRVVMHEVFEQPGRPFLYVDKRAPNARRYWLNFDGPIDIHV